MLSVLLNLIELLLCRGNVFSTSCNPLFDGLLVGFEAQENMYRMVSSMPLQDIPLQTLQ
jgi:hypothetical protein